MIRMSVSGRYPAWGPGGKRFFTACLLSLLCLLGVACDSDSGDAPPPASDNHVVAPHAVFSKRAPASQPQPQSQTERLLVVGDSLSISLGEQLERALSGTPGLDFSRDGTRSTGLTRPELLDWPAHLRERVGQEPPDIVVIMIGANDVMPVEGPDGSRIYFEDPAWPGAYAAKARGLVDICRRANPKVRVYWVGVPTMGEDSLAQGVKKVNAALSTMCAAAPGCRFIDTQAAFADPKGRFSRHGRDAASGETLLLRTADGVHMTETGSKLLGGVVLAGLARFEHLPRSAGADELRAFARDIHPVAEATPEPAQEKRPTPRHVKASKKTYTVKKGDTILGIAHKLGIAADDLAAVNPGVDSTRLSLGQDLHLPAKTRKR